MVKHAGEAMTYHLGISPEEHLRLARASGDWQLRETLEKPAAVIEERFPVAPRLRTLTTRTMPTI